MIFRLTTYATIFAAIIGCHQPAPPPKAGGVDIQAPGVKVKVNDRGVDVKAPGVEVKTKKDG